MSTIHNTTITFVTLAREKSAFRRSASERSAPDKDSRWEENINVNGKQDSKCLHYIHYYNMKCWTNLLNQHQRS